jgi:hypothetical protein
MQAANEARLRESPEPEQGEEICNRCGQRLKVLCDSYRWVGVVLGVDYMCEERKRFPSSFKSRKGVQIAEFSFLNSMLAGYGVCALALWVVCCEGCSGSSLGAMGKA